MNIPETVAAQKAFFRSGATLSLDFRRRQLRLLLDLLVRREQEICSALHEDLHKSPEEAYMTEISMVRGEIRDQLGHLKKWSSKHRVSTPLAHFPSRAYTLAEPLGTVLIVSPWNYPVQLLLSPLAGAIAAGCTAVLKSSPAAPAVSAVLRSIISENFPPEYISLFEGHRDVNEELFSQRFDLIFFTGSPALGKTVMSAAARNLTPVILELGGKSPCIVDSSAYLKVAARRIIWGKSLNSGQTCIAPDYLLVHEGLKEDFVKAFRAAVAELYPGGVETSPHYARIVSDKAFNRLLSYLDEGKILAGGRYDAATRFMEPTLLELSGRDGESVPHGARVMQEEIFGPVFPLISFSRLEEAVEIVNSGEKPLALYYFGDVVSGEKLAARCSSGGACINDTVMHIANRNLPFGGVGNSGMGAYHGRQSFMAFSHLRSFCVTPTWADMPFRYMPYRFIGLIRKILK